MACVRRRVIASMRDFYLSLFSKAYAWSAKQEFDKQPSLYSAVLYISALQLLNLITAVFLIESAGLSKLNSPRWIAAIVPVGLFACNWWWASRNEADIRNVQGKWLTPHKSLWVRAYVLATIVVFALATTVFVYTGPSAV